LSTCRVTSTRLQRSLRELRIDMPMPLASLEVVICETVRRNRVNYGIVYLQVTRGVARRPCISCQSGETCIGRDGTRFGIFRKSGHGIEGYWCHHHSREPLAACRHQVRVTIAERAAKQQARENNAYEAWFVDHDGHVTEGASSNAWIITKDGKVITRSADSGILAGVTRAVLTEVLAALQIKLEVRPFTPAEAYEAAEAFVTASSQIVMPVVRVDGRSIGNGKPGPLSCGSGTNSHRFSAFS
jgi:D-alanine transaminase